MGVSRDGRYTFTTATTERVYLVVPTPDEDGWAIGWKTQYGEKIRPIKKLGIWDTVEEAQEALDAAAIAAGWQYCLVDEDTKSGKRFYRWCKASAADEHVELLAMQAKGVRDE